MSLVVKYTLFAVVATAANLGLQAISFGIYNGPGALYVAIFWGTGGGLVVKYLLDKRYIFYHETETKKEDVRLFFLYSTMGVLTTMVFWGTEIVFHALIDHTAAKYVGATFGLAVGYVTKYHLDKRFVFRKESR